MASSDPQLERLAYEASVRALTHQESALDQLQARTGTLLAASSVAASFLGGQSIQRGGFGVFAVGATAAFVISIVVSVSILLPRAKWVFALQGPTLYEELYEWRDDSPEIYRRLAYWVASFRDANQHRLDPLYRRYRWAASALVLEVLFWIANLSDKLV